jgi:SAM-dependent methyltransferase
MERNSLRENLDSQTVKGFGDEWTRFDQSQLPPEEREGLFRRYFTIFPWHLLPRSAVGFDMGCGSGRWAQLVAPRVGRLHCVDASEAAINVAKTNLHDVVNCEFHVASVDRLPFANDSMDFGYSLGVLHHVPDTEAGLKACVEKLKQGAPFLLYLYYAFDNRPMWFRLLWRGSNVLRKTVSRSPMWLRHRFCQLIAMFVYFPLARLSLALEGVGVDVALIPLSGYRRLSFYTMQTDALDRFGTRLEQRFTLKEIVEMMEGAGLDRIVVSESVPFWCVVGHKK